MNDANTIKLLETENQLLRQAIAGLSATSGNLFCYGCFNYGKKEENYYTTSCSLCEEWICTECTEIKNNNGVEYCEHCYDEIKDKDVITFKIMENTNGTNNPITWDRFTDLFDQESIINYIVDTINEIFDTGENYQYEIDCLSLVKSNDNCMISFYFDIKEEYCNDNIEISQEQLETDLLLYLSGMNDFELNINSEVFNDDIDETVRLSLVL